ncbi:hypothetical protein SDC9_79270 [bioreactor metagenome]|uniref:Uncharacterized protein n=1 Tax=bioreactor metagenome TaxID=1076179 RepID=A0A644YVU4_9ZZZZ
MFAPVLRHFKGIHIIGIVVVLDQRIIALQIRRYTVHVHTLFLITEQRTPCLDAVVQIGIDAAVRAVDQGE